jgi:hypothetical protein
MKRVLACVACLACELACHGEESQKTEPSASATPNTTIVVREATDAATPACTIHFASDAFAPGPNAARGGTVRIEGDYTRTLAKVSVTNAAGAIAWSGTFSGPRDSFVDMIRPHLCDTASVYALKAEGNKDVAKGPIVLDAYVMTANEKSDVDALCNAYARAPNADAGNVQLRDRAAMEWAEDALTTTHWDTWRRNFSVELRDAYAHSSDAKTIFERRAGELDAAAAALGTKCDTAARWKKRAP